MRRGFIGFLAAMVVIGGISLSATAKQDSPDLEATVASLQTQVAILQTQVANLAPEETPTPVSTSTAPASITAPQEGEFSMNETVSIGDFEFSILRTQVATEMEDSSGFLSYEPNNGQFLVVTLSIRNVSQKSQPFPFEDFVIEEQYGAQYSTSMFSGIYFGDKFDSSDDLIPGNTYTLDTLFDIPVEAKNLVYKQEDGSLTIRLDR